MPTDPQCIPIQIRVVISVQCGTTAVANFVNDLTGTAVVYVNGEPIQVVGGVATFWACCGDQLYIVGVSHWIIDWETFDYSSEVNYEVPCGEGAIQVVPLCLRSQNVTTLLNIPSLGLYGSWVKFRDWIGWNSK